jgi:NADP-dependent 3-hydroxy acid dehydrogenase YdfG
MNLTEKVVIIMGASSGIGEATTKLLAEHGFKLVIAARRIDKLKKIKNELPKAAIDYLKADVTNFEEVLKFIKKKYGRVDVLFNNADIT